MPTPSKRKAVVVLPYRRSSGLFRRDGEYIADIQPDSGGRVIRRLGRDRERATRLFNELVAELENGGENPLLTDFLQKTFLPTQQRLKAYAFCEEKIRGVVRFVEATEAGLRLRDVGAHHVERLRAHYARLEYAPRTVNAFQQKLSQALNHAVDLKMLPANPVARVKPLTVDNRRTRFLTMDDFIRILDAAKGTEAHDLFLLIGLTGLRPSNARLLTIHELDGDTLRIPPEKMKNARWGVVPVSWYAADFLAERAEGKEANALLFPARGTENKPKGLRNVQRSFERCAERSDLEWATLYDLRHFFASQLAKQNANEQQIGRLLCHVGQSVTSRYVHHDIEDLRRFVDTLADRFVAATGGSASPYYRERAVDDGNRIAV